MNYNNTKPELTKLAAIALSAALIVSSSAPAFAATQGTLGATSTGSVNINLTKTQLVMISNLTDLTLGGWKEGDAAPQLTSSACVYSTRPNGAYSIKATGSGASSAFTITDGTNLIPYSVTWNSGGAGAVASVSNTLTTNTTQTNLSHASTSSTSCSGGDTAGLVVNITNTAMTAAPDGTYTGTLTLLVSPV